jgi:hypothetical protein
METSEDKSQNLTDYKTITVFTQQSLNNDRKPAPTVSSSQGLVSMYALYVEECYGGRGW